MVAHALGTLVTFAQFSKSAQCLLADSLQGIQKALKFTILNLEIANGSRSYRSCYKAMLRQTIG